MKTWVIIILAILSNSDVLTQEILTSNPIWHVREYDWGGEPPWRISSVKFRVGQKDTINNTEYFVIEKSSSHDASWTDDGIRLRERGDTIFANYFGTESIFLVNNQKAGNTYSKFNCDFTVDEIDSIVNTGRIFERYKLDHKWGFGWQINGVGLEDQVFHHGGLCSVDQPKQEIRCFELNDEIVYQFEEGAPCALPDSIITSTIDNSSESISVSGRITRDGQISLVKEDILQCILVSMDGRKEVFSSPAGHIQLKQPGVYILFTQCVVSMKTSKELVVYVP